MEALRIPFYGFPNNRYYSDTKDQWFKNCFPEKLKTGSEEPLTFITKRFGLVQAFNTGYTAEGRMLFGWDENDNLYSVVGDRIYKGTTEITSSGNRLNNTTGRISVTEIKGGTPRIIIKDGDDMWTVDSSDNVTQVTDTDYTGLSNLTPGVVNIDGYVFVMNDCQEIFQSSVNDPTTWDATEKITASLEPDVGIGIARHLNYIIAFGTYSTEFFYDAANSSGSVLGPVDGINIRYGCAEGKTIVEAENSVIWVSQGRDGGKSVSMFDGNSTKVISTSPIERILNEEKDDIHDAYAFVIKIQGHIFYVLTLPTSQGITLVCDLKEETWWEMSSYNGSTETYFKCNYFAENLNNLYMLHQSNGKIYRADIDIYQDFGNEIKTEIVTNKIDFNTSKIKFLGALDIIGDSQSSTSNVTLDWTDDDYQSWSNTRTIDMSKPVMREHALGSFVRRAFRLKHEANTPFRVQSLEFGVSLGGHSMSSVNG